MSSTLISLTLLVCSFAGCLSAKGSVVDFEYLKKHTAHIIFSKRGPHDSEFKDAVKISNYEGIRQFISDMERLGTSGRGDYVPVGNAFLFSFIDTDKKVLCELLLLDTVFPKRENRIASQVYRAGSWLNVRVLTDGKYGTKKRYPESFERYFLVPKDVIDKFLNLQATGGK